MKTEPLRAFEAESKWPERLIELGRLWNSPAELEKRKQIREEIWILTVGALAVKIRHSAIPHPAITAEDAHDLAVQKGLDLIGRFDRGLWNPASAAAPQLQRFFALIAKNSIIDHLRTHGRRTMLSLSSETVATETRLSAPADEFRADRMKLSLAVIECAEKLTPRARRVWFYRTCYEMSSRQIAAHPEVAMKPTAVDMMLSRCRRKIRGCLESRGFDHHDFGRGVFALLWEQFTARHDSADRQIQEAED